MRAFVFTDKSLERYAGRYVWLSIDTENPKNAPYLKKYPVNVWPSFFVIDPRSEKIIARWVGGASVAQVRKLLDDTMTTFEGKTKGLDERFARAEALYGEGKNTEAAKLYKELLSVAPPSWPKYGRAVDSLLFALLSTQQHEECARIARDAYPKLKNTTSAANVAASGLGCALSLPATNGWRSELVALGEIRTREVLRNPKLSLAADDRSGLYQILEAAREEAHDTAGRRVLLEEHAAFLEREAARAKNAEERTVFDSHRLIVYLELEQPEKAVAMLAAAERDLPDDYNPSARLALAYKALKKHDDALTASDRALAKVYGPRKIGVLRTRADIYAEMGNAAAAKKTIEEAIAFAESLPEGQRSERTIAALRKRLESM